MIKFTTSALNMYSELTATADASVLIFIRVLHLLHNNIVTAGINEPVSPALGSFSYYR